MDELMAVAAAVYEQHGYSPEGIQCLMQKIREQESLLLPALNKAAVEALSEHMRLVRSRISDEALGKRAAPKTYTPELQEQILQGIRGFYRRPLMDGTELGKATREQVEETAKRYEAQAAGNAREGRFHRDVAAKMKPGQKVPEVWTEAQLQKLYRKAQAE